VKTRGAAQGSDRNLVDDCTVGGQNPLSDGGGSRQRLEADQSSPRESPECEQRELASRGPDVDDSLKIVAERDIRMLEGGEDAAHKSPRCEWPCGRATKEGNDLCNPDAGDRHNGVKELTNLGCSRLSVGRLTRLPAHDQTAARAALTWP
jgi:hypothetical protein